MESEKVKDIKKRLEYCQTGKFDLLGEALTLINELEETNKNLKQSNKNILFVNDKVIERNQQLEEALLDMVVQFCQMGKEGDLCHAFMSAEENAFDVLGIEYGEKVDDVYKRFNKKWGIE